MLVNAKIRFVIYGGTGLLKRHLIIDECCFMHSLQLVFKLGILNLKILIAAVRNILTYIIMLIRKIIFNILIRLNCSAFYMLHKMLIENIDFPSLFKANG